MENFEDFINKNGAEKSDSKPDSDVVKEPEESEQNTSRIINFEDYFDKK